MTGYLNLNLNLWTLEGRRNRQALIEAFNVYNGFTKIDITELFRKDSNVKVESTEATH